jgi:hypothetical protein
VSSIQGCVFATAPRTTMRSVKPSAPPRGATVVIAQCGAPSRPRRPPR